MGDRRHEFPVSLFRARLCAKFKYARQFSPIGTRHKTYDAISVFDIFFDDCDLIGVERGLQQYIQKYEVSRRKLFCVRHDCLIYMFGEVLHNVKTLAKTIE